MTQPIDAASTAETFRIRTQARGPAGRLPLTPEMLVKRPSGDLFGLSQDAGMGWRPEELGRKVFLIASTLGGLRGSDGQPIALGYHTGHWEIGLLVEAAARTIREQGAIPFSVYCSDPCDGRTQGTPGMMDSLAYRNDAAQVLRRLMRSLPIRRGIMGVATCDKGLPAMMMALASMRDLPVALVPGGVMLPPEKGEDAGTIQSLGARFAHGRITLDEASELGCRTCASPGGGCQFLGTAATSQVVSEALGLSPVHSALAPSGQAVWIENAQRAARALIGLEQRGITARDLVTSASIRNSMVVHAAFGGSTNLVLHIPAIAHAAGLPRPTVEDWVTINRSVPRLVDVLPNGPTHHPTVRVYLAGGVPEVMLHLRNLGLLDLSALTVTGQTWEEILREWEYSERRRRFRELLQDLDHISADEVISSPEKARVKGLTSTVTFLQGNLAPEGSLVKSTAMDPSVLDADGIYRREGPVKVFTREAAAIAAIKEGKIQEDDIMVLIGCGPLGSGMEETYQLTAALKHLPWGKKVALITDARFSGVSTGACIGHVGPEALAGGPIGKLRDGDRIRIRIDRIQLEGRIDMVGEPGRDYSPEEGASVLQQRSPHPELSPSSHLPDDTRLWAALQQIGGGPWGGCVFDVDAILEVIAAGRTALATASKSS
ncbi:MAG TPA: YjhG/YagF family D-xylonate dehydratase [Candidatus Paceibacterota bacterium]|nr:YjhG/YagF family D-xylonate dehydratase [Verrucomicrobiota bacterium]HRY48206.1 YjhG/YagF family D-xylonate dehydratase [Candidatus Paceibacterota bacterium]